MKDWKTILAKSPPSNFWYSAHDCMIHAHHWNYTDDFTLILIHGAIANNIWWQHIASQMNRGQVYAVDLSGHGQSEWDTPYTLAKHAEEIEVLIDSYSKGPVYIVGHSYGGAVAALAAAHRQVSHAVMLDTPLYIALDHKAPSARAYRKYVYKTKEEAVSRFKPIPNQPILDEALLEHVALSSLKVDEGGYVWQFDPSFHKRDVSLADQALIKPMLPSMSYWYGEYSPFATEATLSRVRDMGMQCASISNAYHAVMLDNPDEVIALINNILPSLDR